MLHQNKAPVFEALLAYIKESVIPMHVPGHKQGRVCDRDFLKIFGKRSMQIDIPFGPGLDNPQAPRTVIKEAEELAAQVYNADYAFFLTNGTSCGINGMIFAACKEGDKILLPRNVHKSCKDGLVFSGAVPVYIQSEFDNKLGIAMGITPEAVQKSIKENPDAKAIIVINPTYYGAASDLQKIVAIAHAHGLLVMVDEAHGGHFYFHDDLPISAMQAGADMAAISIHKMCGSMTQSSLFLMRDNNRITPSEMRMALNYFQSTSQSYILLASLDTSRRMMALQGSGLVKNTLELVQRVREDLASVPGLYVAGRDIVGSPGCFDYDPTKITMSAMELGVSGNKLKDDLRQMCHIECELACLNAALALFMIGDTKKTARKFVEAVKYVMSKYEAEKPLEITMPPAVIPEYYMSPRAAFMRRDEAVSVPLEETEGDICAETIMIYPPGIPVIAPGERINREIIDYLLKVRGSAVDIQGIHDLEAKNIVVFRNLKDRRKRG